MRAFTLLEVIIVLVIVGLISSVIGLRVYQEIQEKKFQTSVLRLHAELISIRHLAINMQADWIVKLKKENQKLVLIRSCPELGQEQSFQWESLFRFFWNHQEVRELTFHFSATGKISPKGNFQLIGKQKQIVWDFPQLFNVTENENSPSRMY